MTFKKGVYNVKVYLYVIANSIIDASVSAFKWIFLAFVRCRFTKYVGNPYFLF